ncbi:hypothetical protein ABPG74_008415 [Tetrahymena malaccensis]
MTHSQILKDKSISSGIQYLWNIIEQISQDPVSEKSRDFLTDLPNILYIILGAENKKGWLTQSFEDLNNPSRFSTVNSEENMRQLILLLSPPIISQQLENCYYKENIYTLLFEKELVEGQKFQLLSNVLPDHITELRKNCVWKHPSLTRFQNLFSSEVSHITDQFIVINPGDWFLFALAFNLKNFRPSSNVKNVRQIQDNHTDPYSVEFMQNPFLLLTRRYLEYFDFLSLSQMQEHKDKRILFKKFCFILEEHLLVEQIFSIHPQNIEILLHYSILDGLQNREVRQNLPARKKSLNPIENEQSTLSNESKIMGNMYDSQLNGGSKISTSQGSQIHQQQHNLANLQGQPNQQQSLMQSANDVVDNFSGYSKNNILQHYLQISNIKEFYNKKSKDSFTVYSNYVFQAILILLHFKRRHFKLLTLQSVYSNATNSNIRGNSSLYGNYYQSQGNLRNSQSNFSYQGQSGRMSQNQISNFQSPYIGPNTTSFMSYGNNQYSKSSQQYFSRLRQQYVKYQEFNNMEITADQFQLEYFRDHGEDNMLTLFFKKISYFLSIGLDDWQKDVTKQSKDTLYDQGRLLASLIGHHKYFEKEACENNLFYYLNQIDQQLVNSANLRNSSNSTNYQTQNSNSNLNSNSAGQTGSAIKIQYKEEPVDIPSRPFLSQYCLNDQEFERLLPSIYTQENSRYSYGSYSQQQMIRTSFREQIGYFTEELSQVRFKILVSSCTLLLNKFITAFSVMKDLSLSDFLMLTLLIDTVFKKRYIDERSLNSSMSYDYKGQNKDEDLITRLNQLDIVTIKHANDFFLLKENDEDIYRVFITPESIECVRKINNAIEQYLNKKSYQKQQQQQPINEIQDTEFLPQYEIDPFVIQSYLKNKLNYVLKRSNQNGGSSFYNSMKNLQGNDKDGRKGKLFEIENRRASYNFQTWKAPLASFESKFLYYIFLQISFFIDFVKNGFQPANPSAKYPQTNLRRFANIYTTVSYLLLFVFLIFIFKWLFSTPTSTTNYNQAYTKRTYQGSTTKQKYNWDLD